MTCPLWIITHPGLKDCDLRVLLMLDQIAWREGDRDGMVHASNRDIGARLGKSASSVKESLHRLAALEPPIMEAEMGSSYRRDSIRLLYDRYGGANLGVAVAMVGPKSTVAQDRSSGGEISPPPCASYQETPESVTVATARHSVGEISPTACGGEISPPLPLKREDLVLVVVGGGGGEISPSHAEVNGTVETGAIFPTGPRTLPELIDWLPGCFSSEGDDEGRMRGVVARLTQKLPLWLQRFHTRFPEHSVGTFCDWVTDALIDSTEAEDPVKYGAKILREWSKAGGRPGIEIKAPEPEVVPAAELPPIHPMPAPAPRAGRFLSKAERNAARFEARRASMAKLYPKEVSDGPR